MLKMYIDGMKDEHCASLIRAALGDLEGMHEIREVNCYKHYALISCNTDENILRDAIENEGYNVSKIEKCD